MNKRIIYIVIIALVFLISCGHYASIINFLNCIFYGECSDFYYSGGSTRTVQLIAGDYNDGTTLEGEWQNKNADNLYILKFLNDGTLNITLYDSNNNLERYDEGRYSIKKDNLTIEMTNGTSNIVKYSISNKILTLNSQEEAVESNQNAE